MAKGRITASLFLSLWVLPLLSARAQAPDIKEVLSALLDSGACPQPATSMTEPQRALRKSCSEFLARVQQERRSQPNLSAACQMLISCYPEHGVRASAAANTMPALFDLLRGFRDLVSLDGTMCLRSCQALEPSELAGLMQLRADCEASSDRQKNPALDAACGFFQRCLHFDTPCKNLLALLGDSDPARRRFAIRQLREMGKEEAIPPLRERLSKEPEAPLRLALLQALYALGRHFPVACQALDDRLKPEVENDAAVRQWAQDHAQRCRIDEREIPHDPLR